MLRLLGTSSVTPGPACCGPTLTPHRESLRMITMQREAEPGDGETSISDVYLIFDYLDPAMPEATPWNLQSKE